ncbi:hypothetical protein AVEN_98406-1 [Araneus ventricosus]|uniref:Uncharacterized protein n=1 Tax=Araneus ventricosus TaxID=182803 RepID=A0A4Y2I3L3_ARAVE|nr:hypothetical protein AVEN_98406-1 [Araneus ventricosus]
MQLEIAALFEVSQPTECRIVYRMSEAIASLLPDYIYLPVNKEECKEMQRSPLLSITKAYSTTSTDAVHVLSGFPPLDIKVRTDAISS